jgi:nucleobase:cation symporter-1, NCS1 family
LSNGTRVVNGIHELTADVSSSKLWNPDIAPTTAATRKWRTWDIAALWVGMAVCIPTYMLASGLMAQGMNWWQALLTILLGNIIVILPMVLNAHAGTKYGIPFPVLCRASFGPVGAHVPAVLRGLVACGWFGIQTWIGGWAIYKGLAVFFPGLNDLPAAFLGINIAQLGTFLFFWAINMYIVYQGMESIRHMEDWGAPLLLVMGLALLAWAYVRAGGFGPMLSEPSQFGAGMSKDGQFWKFFFPGLTGMVGFWATLSLNIPDFTRHAHSQKDQVLGQVIGLPATMVLYSFIGVAVTSATAIIFGERIWDPIELLSRFNAPLVVLICMAALTLATLTTNLAANVVSPAVGFSNLWPRRISFRMGGFITGVIGILMQPWKLVADPTGYIFTWLIGYSALLGSIGGVIIADYYIVRRMELNLPDLYREGGEYWYSGGFNPLAVAALLIGILPNLPGFLAQINVITLASGSLFGALYPFAWFVGFLLSFGSYWLLMSLFRRRSPVAGARLAEGRS